MEQRKAGLHIGLSSDVAIAVDLVLFAQLHLCKSVFVNVNKFAIFDDKLSKARVPRSRFKWVYLESVFVRESKNKRFRPRRRALQQRRIDDSSRVPQEQIRAYNVSPSSARRPEGLNRVVLPSDEVFGISA